MKREVFKEKLKENLIIQAPDGISDKIMNTIQLETEKASLKRHYSMPGKPILLFLSLFFTLSIVWSFLYKGEHSDKLVELIPNFNIHLPNIDSFSWLFNSLNTYLIMGLLIFVILEFFHLKRNHFHFN